MNVHELVVALEGLGFEDNTPVELGATISRHEVWSVDLEVDEDGTHRVVLS